VNTGVSLRDEASFLTFYDATVVEAYRYASRLVGNDRARTEDLVHDVYVGLLAKVKAGSLADIGVGWVLVAIRHRFLDCLRRDQREERRLRLAWSSDTGEDEDRSADLLDGARLSDRERAALTLRYFDDLSVPQIAREMHMSVHAVESLLARARTRVRRSEVRHA
jgi:RNA polymerase sigma-70 factor (ECF subfamily)